MTRFSDLEDDERMKIRRAVENAGCDIIGYRGNGFTAAIKCNALDKVVIAAVSQGFAPTEYYYFPLGSDNPPEEYRHWGKYTENAPGMWLYAHFEPKEAIK